MSVLEVNGRNQSFRERGDAQNDEVSHQTELGGYVGGECVVIQPSAGPLMLPVVRA
jgi:hypothetical protein